MTDEPSGESHISSGYLVGSKELPETTASTSSSGGRLDEGLAYCTSELGGRLPFKDLLAATSIDED